MRFALYFLAQVSGSVTLAGVYMRKFSRTAISHVASLERSCWLWRILIRLSIPLA